MISAKIKIEQKPDVFGILYCVSAGEMFLGSFYQRLDGLWVAIANSCQQSFVSQEGAIAYIKSNL